MTFSAADITRRSTIGEQNLLIAAAYTALLAARDSMDRSSAECKKVCLAIEAIEQYRQKRDPEHTQKPEGR